MILPHKSEFPIILSKIFPGATEIKFRCWGSHLFLSFTRSCSATVSVAKFSLVLGWRRVLFFWHQIPTLSLRVKTVVHKSMQLMK